MKKQIPVYIEVETLKEVKIYCANNDIKVQKFYVQAIEEKLIKDTKKNGN